MATNKSTTKNKKAPKKKVVKKEEKNYVDIVYLNRTPEAIAEMRSSIVKTNCLDTLLLIDEDFVGLYQTVIDNPLATHDQVRKWKMAMDILESRTVNAHKLLNKLVPTFKEEETAGILEGDNASINPEAARDAAIAKLSKALKPKSKVSNIKNAK